MGLSEARGLVLFRVVRGGIGITQRLGATGTVSSTGDCHTHPRTRASQEPTRPPPERSTGDGRGLFTRDAQAACGFSFSASKFSSFLSLAPENPLVENRMADIQALVINTKVGHAFP